MNDHVSNYKTNVYCYVTRDDNMMTSIACTYEVITGIIEKTSFWKTLKLLLTGIIR